MARQRDFRALTDSCRWPFRAASRESASRRAREFTVPAKSGTTAKSSEPDSQDWLCGDRGR